MAAEAPAHGSNQLLLPFNARQLRLNEEQIRLDLPRIKLDPPPVELLFTIDKARCAADSV
jgi:hypothetical protein